MLTSKQLKLLDYLKKSFKDNKVSPSFEGTIMSDPDDALIVAMFLSPYVTNKSNSFRITC